MEIDLDFSELNHSRGDYPDKISQKEIRSVYDNPTSRIVELEGFSKELLFHMACGYSIAKRILLVAARFESGRIKLLQIKVADEIDIETYYCKR